MAGAPDTPFRVRSFRPADQAACRGLYLQGLVGGSIAANDTGTDIDDIEAVYMRHDGNHFWVAESFERAGGGAAPSGEAEVVGMIGVQHHNDEPGVGEIRRLRVSSAHRRKGIGSALVETALRFCQERQYLKVTLDTFMEREPAVRLFEKFRFRHNRTRRLGEKDLMYFYLDLYMGEERRNEK